MGLSVLPMPRHLDGVTRTLERELVDSEMWVDEMEDEAVLMVLGVAPRITYRLRNAIRQVPSDIATSAALLAADVFVTDYSPLLVDFAVTGRPIIFYLPSRRSSRSS